MKIFMMARTISSSLSAPRYTLELSNQLIRQGHKVIMLTSRIQTRVKNTHIIKMPEFFAKQKITPIMYSLIAKQIKRVQHIDIIHGHGYTFQDDVTTVHFLRKAFIQQLKKFRDITYFRNKLPRIETWLERKLLNSSKHLIAVSSMIKRDLMKSYGINSEKISIVHNGVNIREFSPSNKRERKYIRLEYGFEEEAICILFVGGKSYERKGLQFILRAMQFIPKDIYLFVIGGGYEKYKRLIEKLGIVDRVVFIPYINDIRQAYAITDIFILPTIYDPFPLAALEAMASGLPIIISSLAGTIDILRDGINGIILEDPSDIKHLAELITVLVDDHKLREKIGTNARLTAEKLSWENVAREVVKVYEEVA